MEVIFDEDTSFFNITSPNIESDPNITRELNRDIISLTITEELGQKITGSLSIDDPVGIWSKSIRAGQLIKITFGYKGFNENFREISAFQQNPNEILGSGERSGVTAIAQTPAGTFGAGGNTTYNITFNGSEGLGGKVIKTFDGGTRGDLIREVMGNFGVVKPVIKFRTSNVRLSPTLHVQQWEPDFRFLLRNAEEWQTLFHIGHKPDGTKAGLFIDHNKYDTIEVRNFLKETTGVIGSQRTLFYNAGVKSNIISGSWKQNIGENGTGDGVSYVLINGKPVQTRTTVVDQKVITWRLNEKAIETHLSEVSDNVSEVLSRTKKIFSAKDFKSVERFFTKVEESTAPQGLGFEIDLKMYGDPFLTIPLEVKFKENFPPILAQTQNKSSLVRFFVQKSTHTFSKNGYKTDIKVADTYAINGSFINTKNLT